jgi:hypothetical protein
MSKYIYLNTYIYIRIIYYIILYIKILIKIQFDKYCTDIGYTKLFINF